MTEPEIATEEAPKTLSDLAKLSPAVCRAGYFQFTADQSFTNGCVQSRGLFWCKSGCGKFLLNGEEYELVPNDLYILPWNRRITYIPDPSDPMFTGHVHLIPDYREGSDWISDVPHEANEIAFNSPDRRNARILGYGPTTRMKVKADEPMGLLLDYSIRRYIEAHGFEETEGRYLGYLIIKELKLLFSRGFGSTPDYPEEMRRMVAFIDKGFQNAPTVSDLADVIGRSRSHVLKLFKKHLDTSPKDYIMDKQAREARELLLSTTLSIAEVGHKTGFPDPYHFSKWFSKQVGLSPSSYRKNHGPFSKMPTGSTHKPAPRVQD